MAPFLRATVILAAAAVGHALQNTEALAEHMGGGTSDSSAGAKDTMSPHLGYYGRTSPAMTRYGRYQHGARGLGSAKKNPHPKPLAYYVMHPRQAPTPEKIAREMVKEELKKKFR
mmetsp:Transcript_61988/g.139675  ORF Transcript_61988/g.139675 Transcript_61988/m.139675 type:complete len:115 (-) Transcript_61988:56-400(-)